jgi:heavy metal efflux system protein
MAAQKFTARPTRDTWRSSFSVRGRDLGSTVEEAITKVNAAVKLPSGYTTDWAGEYESQKRSQRRLMVVLPVTIVAIFVILYAMFTSVKWALLILTNEAMAPPLGGLLALLVTHTNFCVSSGVGFLALFGVSVPDQCQSAAEGAVLRLRPVVVTLAGRDLWSASCRTLPRNRIGLAAPFCSSEDFCPTS